MTSENPFPRTVYTDRLGQKVILTYRYLLFSLSEVTVKDDFPDFNERLVTIGYDFSREVNV